LERFRGAIETKSTHVSSHSYCLMLERRLELK
jgi:hypothetical protein